MDNVGGGCYGYAITISVGVQRIAISSSTLYGIVVYRRRQTLYFVLLYGFPKASICGQVELEAYV